MVLGDYLKIFVKLTILEKKYVKMLSFMIIILAKKD